MTRQGPVDRGIHFTAYFPRSVNQLLEREARARGLSKAAVVAEALEILADPGRMARALAVNLVEREAPLSPDQDRALRNLHREHLRLARRGRGP